MGNTGNTVSPGHALKFVVAIVPGLTSSLNFLKILSRLSDFYEFANLVHRIQSIFHNTFWPQQWSILRFMRIAGLLTL